MPNLTAGLDPVAADPVVPEDDDDRRVGRVLSRREVLALFGSGGVAIALAACAPGSSATVSPTSSATGSPPGPAGSSGPSAAASASGSAIAGAPSCVVRPALTEGPYFVDEKLQRSDIRSDPTDAAVKDGLKLNLAFAVSRISGSSCVPFAGVLVDVWHCDALGVYSDVQDPSFNTKGKKWLRGYQITDGSGTASFVTIYPGWYQGRTVHIHFKIRTDAASPTGTEFTSQLFFDDAVSDQVFANAPYAQKGARSLRNDGDNIFAQSGGQLTLAVNGDPKSGYSTTFEVGVQLA